MIQQGQVFELKAKGVDGQRLWAYRYRLEGRVSMRPQVGGFASRAEVQKGLWEPLDRVGPGCGGAITLPELVEESLELHQAEPVTIGKPPLRPPGPRQPRARLSASRRLAFERLVAAAWTSHRSRANARGNSNTEQPRRLASRSVDARWTPRLVLVAPTDNEKS